VIRDLSLSAIRAGEVTALVGPNAAGKTTLLRAMAGLLPATGEVRLQGQNLLAMPAARRAALVSYMPQSLPERTSLTVLESVIAPLRVSDHRGEARDRAIAVLDRLGIADIALEPIDRLSGGQRQLCGLAQSLVVDPHVLLLDEPTSALDLRHQAVVMNIVRALAAAGRIIVCVLHDLAQAARWADTVIVMRNGTCHAQGSPSETVTPQMLADVYAVRAKVGQLFGYRQIVVDGLSDKEE
jgi:iron complex transport system ATP-binding protein